MKYSLLPVRKHSLLFLSGAFVTLFLTIPSVFAQSSDGPPTLLPGDDDRLISGNGGACYNLADRIRTGDIHLDQIPCFIKYFSQVFIGLAGTLSVIFVMIGGYTYVLGADDKKEDAKNTITYALIGLAVTLLAWVIVDIILPFITE